MASSQQHRPIIKDEDSDEAWDLEEQDSKLFNGIHPLGLSENYCRDWTEQHAFREFYQNWSVCST